MTTQKQEEIEEIHDMLDSLNDPDAARILGRLRYVDLVDLGIAIRAYGDARAARAEAEVADRVERDHLGLVVEREDH